MAAWRGVARRDAAVVSIRRRSAAQRIHCTNVYTCMRVCWHATAPAAKIPRKTVSTVLTPPFYLGYRRYFCRRRRRHVANLSLKLVLGGTGRIVSYT